MELKPGAGCFFRVGVEGGGRHTMVVGRVGATEINLKKIEFCN